MKVVMLFVLFCVSTAFNWINHQMDDAVARYKEKKAQEVISFYRIIYLLEINGKTDKCREVYNFDDHESKRFGSNIVFTACSSGEQYSKHSYAIENSCFINCQKK